ncbi:hypothetical protein D3C86_2020590 [compost metagenome]
MLLAMGDDRSSQFVPSPPCNLKVEEVFAEKAQFATSKFIDVIAIGTGNNMSKTDLPIQF